MTTNTQTLKEMIVSVITDGDTGRDITDKIVSQYPEYTDYKTEQKGSEKAGYSQIHAEVGAMIGVKEGTLFTIDRNVSPHEYGLRCNDHVDDEEIEVIDIEKTEAELDTGYVYILDTHLDIDGRRIVKIGKANDIEKRVKQLDGEQGAYLKHTVIHSYKVERPYKVEHAIHNALDKGRLNPKKEGFYGDYVETQMDLIEMIVKNFVVE